MFKFTAVSIVLYLVNWFVLKLYLRCSNGATVRLALDTYKRSEKVWYVITGWWFLLNILCIAACAIKLIFMYL